jgi:hypothetical protein
MATMKDFIKRIFKRKIANEFDDDFHNYFMDHIYAAIENWKDLSEEERKEHIKAKNKLQAITGIVYNEVILELDGDKTNQELIDNMYCDKICKELASEDLQFILWGHENNILRRSSKTLEAIMQELTHRAIIGYK